MWNRERPISRRAQIIPAALLEPTAAWRAERRATLAAAAPTAIPATRTPVAMIRTPAVVGAQTVVVADTEVIRGAPTSATEVRARQCSRQPSIASPWAAAAVQDRVTTPMA